MFTFLQLYLAEVYLGLIFSQIIPSKVYLGLNLKLYLAWCISDYGSIILSILMLLKIVLKIVIWEFTNDYIMSKFVTIFKS